MITIIQRLLLLLMGSLVYLGILGSCQSNQVSDYSSERAIPYEHWFGVYTNLVKSGFARMTLEDYELDDGLGYKHTMHMEMKLTTLGSESIMTMDNTEIADAQYRLHSFESAMKAGVVQQHSEGYVQGDQLIVTSGNQTQSTTIPPNTYSNIASDVFAHSLSAEGESIVVRTYDAGLKTFIDSQIRFSHETPILVDGVRTMMGYYTISFKKYDSDSWMLKDIPYILTDQGVPFKVNMGPMEFRLESELLAKSNVEGIDLMESPKVVVEGVLPDFITIQNLQLELVETPTDFQFPQDQRQYAEADLLHIQKETISAQQQQLPFPPQIDTTNMEPYLEGNAWVILTDEDTKNLVNQLTSESETLWEAIVEIKNWVHLNLDKEITPILHTSVQILKQRKGDCKQHAILFAALARAGGIPTKLVNGLVNTHGLNGLYYHAWNEVYLGDQWISLDATFNQCPVDVSHIKISEKPVWDFETVAAIYKLYGNLKFRIQNE